PRVEEAHRTSAGLGVAVRDGLGAGEAVLALGDRPADRAHVRGPARRVEGARPPLVGVERRGLLGNRIRAARDRYVVAMVGDRLVQRDQVVLGGGLSLGELLFLLAPHALTAGAQEEEEAAERGQDDDGDGDQAAADAM